MFLFATLLLPLISGYPPPPASLYSFEEEISLTPDVVSFELKSPNYPSSLTSSSSYKWRIVTEPGSKVRVNFASFNMPMSQGCSSLWLAVSDREFLTENDPQPKWCGSLNPHYAISRSNVIFVYVFAKSNLSSSSRNFILKLERTSEESNMDKLLQDNEKALKETTHEVVIPSGGGAPAYHLPSSYPPHNPPYPASIPQNQPLPNNPFPSNAFSSGVAVSNTGNGGTGMVVSNEPFPPGSILKGAFGQTVMMYPLNQNEQNIQASNEGLVEDEFEPLPPRESNNNSVAWLAAILGLLVSFAILGGVVYWILRERKKDEEWEEREPPRRPHRPRRRH